MDLTTDVVVLGAGGGGAVLGLALSQKGIRSLVFDQAPGPPDGLRGEILQPNGQRILDNLGVLDQIPADAGRPVRFFHFRRVGGKRLCTVDYDMLPPPYNRAIVMWPNIVHRTILNALKSENPESVRYNAPFASLVKQGTQVVGVEIHLEGKRVRVGAKLVVGADGPFSAVREALGISTQLHRYKEGYLVAVLEGAEGIDESQYFVGKKTILGIFPAPGNQAYAFYMIPADSLSAIKAEGVETLQKKWTAVYPDMAHSFETLVDWNKTTYLGTGRVRTKTWVCHGAVLIGDAAHGMNPHASQGRMQAMVDAVMLAEVVESCMGKDDWSVSALKPFEMRRRPQVTMLQQLADEEVFFWNTGNPLLSFLRDRVFSTLDGNARLQYQVLTAKAGMREAPPFNWVDRFQAAGLIPDPRAHRFSPPHLPSWT